MRKRADTDIWADDNYYVCHYTTDCSLVLVLYEQDQKGNDHGCRGMFLTRHGWSSSHPKDTFNSDMLPSKYVRQEQLSESMAICTNC